MGDEEVGGGRWMAHEGWGMKDHVVRGRTGRLIVAKHHSNSFVLDSCRPSFFHKRHTLRSVDGCFSRVSPCCSQAIPPSMEKTITQFDGENDGKTSKQIEFRQERQESPAGGQCAVRGGKCSVFRGRWGPTERKWFLGASFRRVQRIGR